MSMRSKLLIAALVLAVLVAIIAPVLLDEVPEPVRTAIESQFGDHLAFLRELALREPPAPCQDATLEPAAEALGGQDAEWWRQAESQPELFEDPTIVRAKITCHQGVNRLGFAIVSRDRSFVWSRDMLVPPKEWPHVSVWHNQHRHFARYEDRITDSSGNVRSYELVVDLDLFDEGDS